MWQRYTKACAIGVLVLASGCSTVPSAVAPQMPAGATADVTPELDERFRQSVALMEAEKWQEASAELEVITGQHPQFAGPWLNLGIARLKLGKIDSAETALKAAIQRNPNNPVAYNELGILYRHSGRFEEALDMYQSALQVAPEYTDTYWNMGILYDLYLPDAGLALQYYERYQQMTGSDDRQLQTWIDTLRKQTQQPVQG